MCSENTTKHSIVLDFEKQKAATLYIASKYTPPVEIMTEEEDSLKTDEDLVSIKEEENASDHQRIPILHSNFNNASSDS